jgi:hypothetical protein
MATLTRFQFRADGPTLLIRAQLVLAADFAMNGTNYWTATLRVRRAASGSFSADATGQLIGSAYSLATRSVSAGNPATMYYDAAGLALAAGDTVWATYTSTGSPAVIDPHIDFELQRKAG